MGGHSGVVHGIGTRSAVFCVPFRERGCGCSGVDGGVRGRTDDDRPSGGGAPTAPSAFSDDDDESPAARSSTYAPCDPIRRLWTCYAINSRSVLINTHCLCDSVEVCSVRLLENGLKNACYLPTKTFAFTFAVGGGEFRWGATF